MNNPLQKPNFWQIIASVCAALFGVQNDDNRHRDFNQGNFIYFAIVSIILVALFVIALIAIVNIVLAN